MVSDVDYVCKECNCSGERAKKLLSICGNNPQKAVRHHHMLQDMLRGKGHSAAQKRVSTPPTPPSDTEVDAAGREIGAPPKEPKEHGTPPKKQKLVGMAAWNFKLPLLPEEEAADILDPSVPANDNGPYQNTTRAAASVLHLRGLCAAIQHGASLTVIQRHLQDFPNGAVQARIDGTIEGIPSIFYAAQSNNPSLLRLWATYGANVSAVHTASGTPLLAYCIALSEQLDGRDTSSMVATLLSLGTSPKSIPDAFYQPYNRDLSEAALGEHIDGVDATEDGAKDGGVNKEWQWCQPAFVRSLMARTTHLTNRYYLDRASRLRRPSVRHRQVLVAHNAESVLGIPHYLIGQRLAAGQLLRKLLTYLTVPREKPLVLVFAGPSGHGKTELARKLGYLLGLGLQVVDCTVVSDERELFGPRAPYVGSERGSPLNNFLTRYSGQRSIVFLDEFEKTTRQIHQALLVPFDNGEHQDRRTLNTVDCKRTIWILATNALDDTILQFCGANPDILVQDTASSSQAELVKTLAGKLSRNLRSAFLDRFGAPVTGRVSDFVPFLPFSKGEQAVVAHKYLLAMAERVAAPVVLGAGPGQNMGSPNSAPASEQHQQLLGNVRLRIERDASVCSRIAEAEYSEELGARSLHNAVGHVQDKLVEAYLEEDTAIEEKAEQDKTDYIVDIRANEIVVRKGE